jgi:hypothetical protein
MSAVAASPPLELEDGLRIEPWELHSELVLVCPEVCRRALELLPERDPDAVLANPREPILFAPPGTADQSLAAGLPATISKYAFWRLVETARVALFAVGGLIALASLAELVH